jgi:carboxyl-terminal processing protease
MLRSSIHTLLIPLLLLGADARAESPPLETAQGDLSQVGDVGPAPTELDRLLALELDDRASAEAFHRALAVILDEYQGADISEADLYIGALTGMLDVLNRLEQDSGATGPTARNALMTQQDAVYVDQMVRGCKTGIGIEFQPSTSEGVLYITRVHGGSPAERSGLRPGDMIVGIDGAPLLGRELGTILTMLRGSVGTPIGLSLLRPPMRFNVVLTRAEYELPSVEARLLDDRVGLLRISQFHGRTAAEARVALADLAAMGAQSLVLDLRGNQGGLLTAVQEVASLVLDDGTVVARVQDAQGRERDLATSGPGSFHGPMICLVSRWTSSGAEMLAAALQEHDRALLVGETTMGKAITESLYRLTPGMSLRLSSTVMMSPLGYSWQGGGLTPDYLVQGAPLGIAVPGEGEWPALDVQVSFARELFFDPSAFR